MFQQMIRQVYHAGTYSLTGKIENIVGMSIEASGGQAAVGDICRIYNGVSGKQVTAEVVGFKNNHMLLMPEALSAILENSSHCGWASFCAAALSTRWDSRWTGREPLKMEFPIV